MRRYGEVISRKMHHNGSNPQLEHKLAGDGDLKKRKGDKKDKTR